MQILLLGRNGRLGSCLVKTLSKSHKVIALDKSQFNLSNSYSKFKILKRYKPEIIINAAAYTDVVGAEENKKYALEVNSDSLRFLTEFASSFILKLSYPALNTSPLTSFLSAVSIFK